MAVKQAERIPTTILLESLRKAQDFPNDLNIILEKGNIKRVRLAKALGVSRRELYRWRKGISQPQEPIIIHAVSAWAEDIRKSSVS